MRESMLEISAVIHNRGGEVGKILFAKEARGNLRSFSANEIRRFALSS